MGMIIGAVVGAALLYVFLQAIIGILFNGAIHIANLILSGAPTTFSIARLKNILPNIGVDLLELFTTLAWALLTILLVLNVFKSIYKPMTGEQAEHPFSAVVRAGITGLMLAFWKNIYAVFVTVANAVVVGLGISNVTTTLQMAFELDFGLITDVGMYLAYLAFGVALCYSVIGAAITYIERYLSFAIYIMITPLCLVTYANQGTSDTAKQWFMGVLSQVGAIILSLLCWKLFITQMGSIQATDGALKIYSIAVALALLSLVKNSEKILNMLGLRTMANGAVAGSFMSGMMTTIGAIGMGARIGSGVGKALNKPKQKSRNWNDISNQRQQEFGKGGADRINNARRTGGAIASAQQFGKEVARTQPGTATMSLAEFSNYAKTNGIGTDGIGGYGVFKNGKPKSGIAGTRNNTAQIVNAYDAYKNTLQTKASAQTNLNDKLTSIAPQAHSGGMINLGMSNDSVALATGLTKANSSFEPKKGDAYVVGTKDSPAIKIDGTIAGPDGSRIEQPLYIPVRKDEVTDANGETKAQWKANPFFDDDGDFKTETDKNLNELMFTETSEGFVAYTIPMGDREPSINLVDISEDSDATKSELDEASIEDLTDTDNTISDEKK